MDMDPSDEEDAAWVRDFRRGRGEGFNRLVLKHKDRVYTLALRLLADRDAADEAAQDTFLRAFRGIKGFRGESRFSAWLDRIAEDACRERMERLGGTEREADEAPAVPGTAKAPDRFLTKVHARIAAASPWRRLLAALSSPRLLPVPLTALSVLLAGGLTLYMSRSLLEAEQAAAPAGAAAPEDGRVARLATPPAPAPPVTYVFTPGARNRDPAVLASALSALGLAVLRRAPPDRPSRLELEAPPARIRELEARLRELGNLEATGLPPAGSGDILRIVIQVDPAP